MTIEYVVEPMFVNGPNTATTSFTKQCRPLTVEQYNKVRADALALHQHTLSLSVLRSEYNTWPWARKWAYLGAICSTSLEQASISPIRVTGSYREKNPSSLKRFLKRKEAGEIVLNPLFQYEFVAMETPHLAPLDPSKDIHGFRSGNLMPAIGMGAQSPCDGYAYALDGFDDVYLNANALAMSSPVISTYLSNNVVKRYFTSETDLELFTQRIIAELQENLQINHSLVTAVRCEANSGIYDVLTELAELPETVKFLYGVIREIITSFRNTRKQVLHLQKLRRKESDASAVKELVTNIASLWMSYRYAIIPLVYSANDVLDLLALHVSKYHTFRDGSRESVTVSRFGQEIEIPVIHRCFLKRLYKLEGATTVDHLKMDVLATAWETIPLSFVVDWALNVGDFLSAFGVPDQVEQEACSYSWKVDTQTVIKTPDGSTVALDLRLYENRIIDPGLNIGLNLDLHMNWKRTLDAMSLSWFQFRKRD